MISAIFTKIKLTTSEINYNKKSPSQTAGQAMISDSLVHGKTTSGTCTWLKFTHAIAPNISAISKKMSSICQNNKWQNNTEPCYKRAKGKVLWSKWISF